ncbi:MAG: hypothetical protein ABFC71_10130 [Methanoregula sp.]
MFPQPKNKCEAIPALSASITRSCPKTQVMPDIFSGFSAPAIIFGRETSGSGKPIKINVTEDDRHA